MSLLSDDKAGLLWQTKYPSLNPSRKGRDFFLPRLAKRGLGSGWIATILLSAKSRNDEYFVILRFCLQNRSISKEKILESRDISLALNMTNYKSRKIDTN
ncbi:hypothetical protein ACWIWK_02220 [Helicobacter sp. 23-1048]